MRDGYNEDGGPHVYACVRSWVDINNYRGDRIQNRQLCVLFNINNHDVGYGNSKYSCAGT